MMQLGLSLISNERPWCDFIDSIFSFETCIDNIYRVCFFLKKNLKLRSIAKLGSKMPIMLTSLLLQ